MLPLGDATANSPIGPAQMGLVALVISCLTPATHSGRTRGSRMLDASRRAVLAAGGLGAAALVSGPSLASAAATVPPRSAFVAVRGTVVQLRGPSGLVRAVVAEVNDLAGARAGDPHRYSVLLKPSSATPDGIYTVSGRRLGRTSLFLGNVDRGRGAGLEAVVHRAPA